MLRYPVSSQFCKDLALQIQLFGPVIGARGDRGAAIPYLGFVEVNLQIPGITNCNEDVLLLVILTTTYSKMVPVMVGSKVIDKAPELDDKMGTCKGDHNVETGSLQSCHVSVTSAKLHKLRQIQNGRRSRTFLSKGYPIKVRKFSLDDVRGPVCTTTKVTIPPFSTVNVHVNSSVKGHCM